MKQHQIYNKEMTTTGRTPFGHFTTSWILTAKVGSRRSKYARALKNSLAVEVIRVLWRGGDGLANGIDGILVPGETIFVCPISRRLHVYRIGPV
jgi:hypothetical protein